MRKKTLPYSQQDTPDIPDFHDLEEQALDLLSTIDTLRHVYTGHPDIEHQLVNVRVAACTIAKYARALPAFINVHPTDEIFVLDKETGALRKATTREIEEVLLDKKSGSILDLVNTWDVNENGDWVRLS